MNIRPLRDNVVIRRLEYKHDFLYVAGQKLSKGAVIAVGPGRRMRQKTRFQKFPGKDEGSIFFEDGDERVQNGTPLIRPMRVKVGDIVEFGHRGLQEVEADGEILIVCGEQSCYGKTDASQAKGMFGQQSAGFDPRHAVV
jgi:co-chaperonin GroES (HSP10)